MFYRYKTGEAPLAYPLAEGMFAALAKRNLLDADAIVPVPLSPKRQPQARSTEPDSSRMA